MMSTDFGAIVSPLASLRGRTPSRARGYADGGSTIGADPSAGEAASTGVLAQLSPAQLQAYVLQQANAQGAQMQGQALANQSGMQQAQMQGQPGPYGFARGGKVRGYAGGGPSEASPNVSGWLSQPFEQGAYNATPQGQRQMGMQQMFELFAKGGRARAKPASQRPAENHIMIVLPMGALAHLAAARAAGQPAAPGALMAACGGMARGL